MEQAKLTLPVLGAFFVYNLFTFTLYGVDKRRAKRGEWRISERALLLCAAFFGALGALAGMLLFRHKTKHRLFLSVVPLCFVFQTAALLYLLLSYLKLL